MLNDTVRFWIAWVLLTLGGYVVAILILLPIVVRFAYSGEWPPLVGLLTGAVLGATTGTGQWLLLRRRTPVNALWVVSSIIGGMLAMALAMVLAPDREVITTTRTTGALVIPWAVVWQTALRGAFFGIGMGLGQWGILRQYARSAYWWIFFNGVAWMAGLAAGALVAPFAGALVGLLMTGLIIASITAQVMEGWQWEMRKRTGPIPGRYAI